MKLGVVWNVWNNYEDLHLGSEILRLSNEELGVFEELRIFSQGGYHLGPSTRQKEYLDEFFHIAVDENHPLISLNPKYVGVLRVLLGLKHAYEYGKKFNLDYLLVTNADAWCLDINLLHDLFKRFSDTNCAVGCRVGKVTGLDLNYGSWAPFIDDHFTLLNVKECDDLGVFVGEISHLFDAKFVAYGGLHYLLGRFFDIRVPQNKLWIYSDCASSINHYGERSGFSLLPWQYEVDFAFLHANCAQDEELHPLRAAFLVKFGFDRFPVVRNYVSQNLHTEKPIRQTVDFVYYKDAFHRKLAVTSLFWLQFFYFELLRISKFDLFFSIKEKLLNRDSKGMDNYKKLRWIYPLPLASRRVK